MIDTNPPKPLKVLYFGTYRANYSRNQITIAGLHAAEVEVVECHVPLWKSIEDRVQIASGNWASCAFAKRLLITYSELLHQYNAINYDYDVMILGYPGQADVFLARFLTWKRGKPLVMDMFMSIYLIALERHIGRHSPISINLLYWLEWFVCLWPDLLIANTNIYVEWFQKVYGFTPKRFCLLPTGADTHIFQPLPCVAPKPYRVLYYGSYIPNHGVEIIIKAAQLLRIYPDIHFELIGDGPTKTMCQQLAELYKLPNITFISWVTQDKLTHHMACADIILGAFGTTPQSLMTIHNKVYEGLAMKKPVITGYSETIANIFEHQKHIYLVERTNPLALVTAIIELKNNPLLCKHLSEQGYSLIMKNFTIVELGKQLKQHLESFFYS